AAPLAIYGNFFVERILKIDDPVGAFGIHGLNGLFGLLTVGLFADGTYGGVKGFFLFGAAGAGQLAAQLVDMVVVAGFSFTMGLIIFGIIKHYVGLRAPIEDEIEGLDISEHGFSAYPEVVMKKEDQAWLGADIDGLDLTEREVSGLPEDFRGAKRPNYPE
ncbi:MAG: ammonium transporter, Amt family, partial [Thermoproteota archaeon]|nr:ammonium transporter, Amt family [Thermoproteota archaeon]